MELHERLKNVNIDFNNVVYTLSYQDVLFVIEENLDKNELDALTDKELEDLIKAVADGFENIDWCEWGAAALQVHLYENPKKIWENE